MRQFEPESLCDPFDRAYCKQYLSSFHPHRDDAKFTVQQFVVVRSYQISAMERYCASGRDAFLQQFNEKEFVSSQCKFVSKVHRSPVINIQQKGPGFASLRIPCVFVFRNQCSEMDAARGDRESKSLPQELGPQRKKLAVIHRREGSMWRRSLPFAHSISILTEDLL